MKKLLIIEDDQMVASLFSNKFLGEGYEVRVAGDGTTGLRLMSEFKPDAVVLDLMLPGVHGVDIIRQIRAVPDNAAIPIVVMTNSYLSSIIEYAWKAGANQCLFKSSATPKQLFEVVEGLLAQVQKGMEIQDPARFMQPGPIDLPDVEPPSEEDIEKSEGRRQFLSLAPRLIEEMRADWQLLLQREGEEDRIEKLLGLYRKVHIFSNRAVMAGSGFIIRLASALEAFMKELHEKPRHLNASNTRTLGAAVDFLQVLVERGNMVVGADEVVARVLVVDDEAISRRAVGYALEKAKLQTVSVDHPHAAWTLLEENPFDLIVLDVNLPDMDGFELCKKIRGMSRHEHTPVVFVTALSTFEARAQSGLSGGNDLIGKPFLFMELAVKALIFVQKNKLGLLGS